MEVFGGAGTHASCARVAARIAWRLHRGRAKIDIPDVHRRLWAVRHGGAGLGERGLIHRRARFEHGRIECGGVEYNWNELFPTGWVNRHRCRKYVHSNADRSDR